MTKHVKIIGCLLKGVFSGQISYDEKPYTKISLEGDERIAWSKEIFSKIQVNEQIDTKSIVCQCILFSDEAVSDCMFFPVDKTNAWQWKEVVKAAEAMGIKPARWLIDGKELAKNINSSLPNSKSGEIKQAYIYAKPKLDLPKECTPWRTTTKETQIINSKPKQPEQVIAEPPKQAPLPNDSTSVYDALRKIATSPKN